MDYNISIPPSSPDNPQKYIDNLLEELELIYGSVSKFRFTRLSGSFSINIEGVHRAFQFIGTTHEKIEKTSQHASPEEIQFILNSFGNKNLTVLVEQGSSTQTEHSIFRDLSTLFANDPELQDNFLESINNAPIANRNELGQSLALSGLRSINIDTYSFEGMKYLYEKGGSEFFIKYCLNILSTDFSEYDKVWIKVLMKIIKHLEIDITEEEVQKVGEKIIPRLGSYEFFREFMGSLRFKADQIRDDFMTEKILSAPEDSIVLANTGHIMGILKRLRDKITHIELDSSEFAKRHYEQWWAN